MPATQMALATRYFEPGTTKIDWLLTIASSTLVPIRAEINAGTDVSRDVAAIAGFVTTSAQVATPDLGARFVSQIPGRINADDSSITFYASVDGLDVRSVLQRDLNGYVLIMDGGDVATRFMDVFKVTVSSVGKVRDMEDAPRLTVGFTIRNFAENVVIPA